MKKRAGTAVFRRVRSQRWADARANAGLLIGLTVFILLVAVGSTWLLVRLGRTHLAAFFAGVYLMMWLSLFGLFFTITGTMFQRMGGTAEQWTSSIFRKLKGGDWKVFDNVPFGSVDVDHVVVGPRHLLAVETKWTSRELAAHESGHLQGLHDSWVAQVRRSARLIRQLLRESGVSHTVTPVLVVWGPGIERTERGWFKIGEVTVLIGKQSRRWKDYLERAEWTTKGTHTAAEAVSAYLERDGF